MRKKIVVLGGGSGLGPVVEELRNQADITAVVPATDRGGSSGKLMRDGMTELPAGDAAKAIGALSDMPKDVLRLFAYRYPTRSEWAGHSVFNLLTVAAQGMSGGDFTSGLEFLSKAFDIKGRVLTSTLEQNTELCIKRADGSSTCGEKEIDEQRKDELPEIVSAYLSPPALINPAVKQAVIEADAVVLAPGSFYTSFAANVLVEGMSEALQQSGAKIILITNLANEPGHTTGWTAHRYAEMAERYIAPTKLDVVFINTGVPRQEVIGRYTKKGEGLVKIGARSKCATYSAVEVNFLSTDIVEPVAGDPVRNRSLLRHDPHKLARRIMIELED